MSKANLYTGIAVVIAIIVVAYFFFFVGFGPSTQQNTQQSDNNQATSQTGAQQSAASPTSVVVQDTKAGTGAAATAGQKVEVNYVGKLQDGTVFDSSSAHGSTFSFVLGAGQVIPGWEQGIAGMKVGGERVLIVPPSLAYGAQDIKDQTGKVVIPANSTLIFDVQLVSVSTSTAQ